MTVLGLNDLTISTLQQAYQQGLTPTQLITALLPTLEADKHGVWISLLTSEQVMPYAQYLSALTHEQASQLPLYGIPFAIKDNIDLVGLPTTAACPAFAYEPTHSATVVTKLIEAGAIPLGKTNLDQFATGLNGTRSPYGVCRNSINPDYISGGSSAGSAVAVALGQASFALGTDTAGSGRIPAMFNHLIGVKPSCGLLSTQGVVPACRTLDCVTIFTKTVSDAKQVLAVAQGYDELDPFSRHVQSVTSKPLTTVGVPSTQYLEFFGQDDYAELFQQTIQQLKSQGIVIKEIDFAPFLAAARALYQGAWVAERYHVIAPLLERDSQAILPVIRQIVEPAIGMTAEKAFTDRYHMASLKRQADNILASVDMIMTPTSGAIYTIADMLENPIELNSRLGYYTNFMNLLDYAALALPAGSWADGLPFGVTWFAPAGSDQVLLTWANEYPLEG